MFGPKYLPVTSSQHWGAPPLQAGGWVALLVGSISAVLPHVWEDTGGYGRIQTLSQTRGKWENNRKTCAAVCRLCFDVNRRKTPAIQIGLMWTRSENCRCLIMQLRWHWLRFTALLYLGPGHRASDQSMESTSICLWQCWHSVHEI